MPNISLNPQPIRATQQQVRSTSVQVRTGFAAAVMAMAGCSGATPGPVTAPQTAVVATTAAVAHVQGEGLVGPDGRALVLRGVAFGNRVWSNDRLPRTHHDERDYQRLHELGMNAVRFYLNYLTFESDAAPGKLREDGFKWLDDNIAWAKKHRIYLVLNFHVPPGGYQSLGNGKALWHDGNQQARFIALWRAIAARYAHEPTIAGYDLLNEPVVETDIGQWKSLAERTITAIREIDPNHAIFVERVNAVGADWAENDDRNFFRVSDPNVVYEFHFYKPFHFTHQGAPWVDFAAASAHYPDARVAEAEWFQLNFATGTFESPKLPPGDSDWHYYEGRPFTVKGRDLAIAKPSLVCASVDSGRAYFDDIVLERLDGSGKSVETLWQVNLDTARGWYFWEKQAHGSRTLSNSGHGDATALSITGTVDDANLGGDPWRFRPAPNSTYRLSGWMKGEQIPATANCQIRLDFYTSTQPVHARDRGYVEQELNAYLAWGKREKVPLFLGEFGAIKAAFDDDRGGIRWVSDMLELLHRANVSYTYHDYHEQSFGLYYGDEGLPDPEDANQALLQLFKAKLGAK
jgi:endoglucanase